MERQRRRVGVRKQQRKRERERERMIEQGERESEERDHGLVDPAAFILYQHAALIGFAAFLGTPRNTTRSSRSPARSLSEGRSCSVSLDFHFFGDISSTSSPRRGTSRASRDDRMPQDETREVSR